MVHGLYHQFGSGGVLNWFSGSAGVLASNGACAPCQGRDNGSGEREREREREGGKEREGGREEEREGGKEGEREGGREGGREGERICTVPYGSVPVR